MSLWISHQQAPQVTDAEFLAAHEDLRDVLEPLLEPPGDAPAATAHRAIDDYRIVRELGRGGMGVVYEAQQISLGRTVALKVVAGAALSTTSLARLRREARILARLDHPAIVKVLTVLESEPAGYAMERIDGIEIDRVPLDHRGRVELAARVADALQHAHEAGIVHRDVKPQNILVRTDGSPVLVDFGLAHDAELLSLTRSGALAGTPFYVAPEQVRGDPADARSDVFSLGVTLYELLAGRRPFLGGSTEQVLSAIVRGDPPDPRRFAPELPRDLAAIVLKAIEHDRDRRYASAADMAADLRAWLAGNAVTARTPSRAARAWRWCRREPWRAAAFALLAVAVPVAATAIGFFAAKQPLWQAAEALQREQTAEELRADGAMALIGRNHAAARAAFAAALEFDTDPLLTIGGLALAQDSVADAVALLDRHADPLERSPALRALRDDLTTGRNGIDREAIDEVDAILTGMRVLVRERVIEYGSRSADAPRAAMHRLSLAARIAAPPKLWLYVLWAHAAANAGDADAGREAAAALRRLWPDSQRARNAEAVALTAADPPRALAMMRERTALEPTDWLAWSNLMRLAQTMGDRETALAAARRVAALKPDHAGAHASVAVQLIALGRDADALAEWRRTLELDPHHVLALNELAIQDLRERRPEEAIARLQTAIAHAPEYASAHHNLGLAKWRLGDRDSAVANFERALQLDPRARVSQRALSRVLTERGDTSALRAACERWAAANPQDFSAWQQLAQLLLDPATPQTCDPAAGLLAALHGLAAAKFGNIEAFALLARALAANGDPAAAAAALAAARAALPDRGSEIDQAAEELARRR
jgi:tetratricopeptide (TPR) repeat protein/predicted Ser/Thr protein kinase